MKNSSTLKVSNPSDREITITREFDAPRNRVFDALTRPEYVSRWLLGPPGWTMPVCEINLKVGGRYRWVWKNEKDGTEMGMGGVFREIVRPESFVATEKFDNAWYPGEAVVTNSLEEKDGKTTLTLNIQYESKDAHDIASKADMEKGVGVSYDRLDEILESQGTETARA